MGRWSWVTLAGKGTTQVTFISAYRVCDGANGSSIISKTVRVQLEVLNTVKGLGTVDLQKQTVQDLLKFIAKRKDDGQDIVLMIDANEASGRGSGVDQLMMGGGLVDAHTLGGNQHLEPPATHQRGSAKIDFVLITPRLKSAVRAATILPICDGYLSDHRALVVDFDPVEMFEDTTTVLVEPASRRLTSTNPRAISPYSKEMKKHFQDNTIVERARKLQQVSNDSQWTNDSQEVYEAVDLLLKDGQSRCEKKCPAKKSGAYPWSKSLDLARDTYLYWKLR